MIQAGFHGRQYAIFREGQRVTRKAWQGMLPLMDASFHNYILNIRQSLSEDIFAERYRSDHNKSVFYRWRIIDYTLHDPPVDGYNITATITGSEHTQIIKW